MLRRAAYSPNIKERADCSARCSPRRASCSYRPSTSRCTSARCRPRSRAAIDASAGAIRPGEQVILNDPFAGGTHLNDVTLVAPVLRRRTVGRLGRQPGASRRRRRRAPGSMPADATEIYQEGLRLPPVLLTEEVRAVLVANSPHPRSAAVTSTPRSAPTGSVSAAGRLGRAGPLTEVLDYGERRMRAALAAVDDGTWTFADVIDSTGRRPSQQRRPHPGHRHHGRRRITFDFTGTDPSAGNVNAVEAVTVPAVAFAMRTATDPTIPANGGGAAAGDVDRAAGTLVAARRPPPWRRQRRGQPAGRRRVPGRPRPGGPRPGRRRRRRHDEQPHRRRRRVGCTRRSPAGRAPGPAGRHERRPHRDDQHPQHAHRGVRAGVPAAGPPLGCGGRGGGGRFRRR